MSQTEPDAEPVADMTDATSQTDSECELVKPKLEVTGALESNGCQSNEDNQTLSETNASLQMPDSMAF